MRSIYELWMEQSRDFFATSEQYLKGLFGGDTVVNPTEHIEHIQTWLSMMKQQWRLAQAAQNQQEYWQVMTNICSDAADMMLDEWLRRTRDNNPVISIQELYQIWLNCCHEVYQRSLQSREFQSAYGEFMNTAFRFWKNAVPTN